MDAFEYFQHLRDKHVVHDENAYSQSLSAVALNARQAAFKVADVISMSITASTIDEQHIRSMLQLVNHTFGWVERKRDELHNMLGSRYESLSYDELLNLPNVTYTNPTASSISVPR